MITKGEGILRDVDLLKEIDKNAILPADLKDKLGRGAIVSFSFSTLDEKIAQSLEPGATLPRRRLEVMQQCKEAGLLVGMNCIPTLPFISDTDEALEQMVKSAKEFHADYILVGGLTLFGDGPSDSKTLYYKFIERHYPHVISDYKKLYRIFPMPSKHYIAELDKRVDKICQEYGVKRGIL